MRNAMTCVLLVAVLAATACDIDEYPGLSGEIQSVTGVDTSSPASAATGVVNKMSGEPSGDPKEAEEFGDALGLLTAFKQQENEHLGDKANGRGDFGGAAKHFRKALDHADDDPNKTFTENEPQRKKRAELYRKLADAEQMQARRYPGNPTPPSEAPAHLKAAGDAYAGSAENRAFAEQYQDWADAGRMYWHGGYTPKACDAWTFALNTAQTPEQRAWVTPLLSQHCGQR